MDPTHIIACKRDGQALSDEQIAAVVESYAGGKLADYQMAALAMAIYLRGMDVRETATLTRHMLHSGDVLEWTDADSPVVDKHSTGGIGDKVSLLLAPLLACCDLRVPMISGRGLGATGGTLDKLESIPGFRTDLTNQQITRLTRKVGCVITGATERIAPADRKLYALRDVTATVASIPLITASIMSKKLAEGLDALVLDVKFGSGAFMKSLDEARRLARSLVDTGRQMGVATSAILSDMNQPLGRMVGNAVEVDEVVSALQQGQPRDLVELTLALGAELLVLTGRADEREQAEQQLEEHWQSGAAREKFAEMVTAQGGDLDAPRARAKTVPWLAPEAGYVAAIDAEMLGRIVIELGGGRRTIGQNIDHRVGLEMCVRQGDSVQKDQPLFHIFMDNEVGASQPLRDLLRQAVSLAPEPVEALPLIVERIGGTDAAL